MSKSNMSKNYAFIDAFRGRFSGVMPPPLTLENALPLPANRPRFWLEECILNHLRPYLDKAGKSS